MLVSKVMPSCLRARISAANLLYTASPIQGFNVDVFPNKWALIILGTTVSLISTAHSSLLKFGSSLRISAIAIPSSVSPVIFSQTPDNVYTIGFCEVSQKLRASSILSCTAWLASAAFLPRSVEAACCPTLREFFKISLMNGESCSRSFMDSQALFGSFTNTIAEGPASSRSFASLAARSASVRSSSSSSSFFALRRNDSAW
mmetsp:Transcript_26639/g.53240  ORF Transcript_26639/g.53240 Transcript_26639/m.53240 type:complete len:202 (-) Transcript_26639:438-1043(-)